MPWHQRPSNECDMLSDLGNTSALSRSEWEERSRLHRERVSAWTDDRTQRCSRNIPHPVYDFLFDYYPFRPAHLKRWSPGFNILLEDATPSELDWPEDFVPQAGGACITASSFPERRRPFLEWALKYLVATGTRQPLFSCFGLHEWAMVYQSDTPRHARVPMRLKREEIDAVVENSDLRCTHYDAFRFFTPGAVTRNRNALSREATTDFDQRACIHVTMDLYRFANKIAPWCSSELLGDAFLLAADARQVDMRASPYDLRDQGFEPIRIENSSGREEYIQEQRRLAELAAPIRGRLVEVYTALVDTYR